MTLVGTIRRHLKEIVFLIVVVVVFKSIRWGFRPGLELDIVFDLAEYLLIGGLGWWVYVKQIKATLPLYLSVYGSAEVLFKETSNSHATVAFVVDLLAKLFREFFAAESKIINHGLSIGGREMERFASVAFSNFFGSYVGTDENPPSEFSIKYPGYLKSQIEGHRNPKDIAKDIRILTISEEQLVADYRSQRNEFRDWYDEHRRNGIMLVRVDPALAKLVAEQRSVPSPAFGVFGRDFVVFFEQTQDPQAHRKITVVPLNSENIQVYRSLVIMMLSKAERIVCGISGLPKCEKLSDADRSEILERLPL